jgi:hypothetical protein
MTRALHAPGRGMPYVGAKPARTCSAEEKILVFLLTKAIFQS